MTGDPSSTARPQSEGRAAADGIVPLEYPVQSSKVQAPPLRDDTLARDRLLDWLSVKVHSRVVLLVAEAGYGKTTLLADFSRRTRARVLWFRLDHGDRDWLGFMAHLVAAVRVHIPTFGSATASLLRDAATGMPSLDAALDVFLREIGSLPGDSTVMVFDDVHAVDDSADVKSILRELLARGPDRMSFVFASRREPPIRLARLRALGEVAELDSDDLRFDAMETEQLFAQSYEIPLEPSVLAELNRRTEGWAASLQLVRAAIRDRSPSQVRSFISSLSGAEGHLYEYLAEEVIGDLPEDLQQFLMRTSVLETVDLTLGAVAAGIAEPEAKAFTELAERHGLLTRRGGGSRGARAHPLVREYLAVRLLRQVGDAGVRQIHREIAVAASAADWQAAARHFIASGHKAEALRILETSIERIIATGEFGAAQELAERASRGSDQSSFELVLLSRLAQQRFAIDEALNLAEQARAIDPTTPSVLTNLAAARALTGDMRGALEAARQLGTSPSSFQALLGRTFEAVLATSLTGSLELAESELVAGAKELEKVGAAHHRAVALHNLTFVVMAEGRFEQARRYADEAIALLDPGSTGMLLAAARSSRVRALLYLGELDVARREIAELLTEAPAALRLELAGDVGEAEALVGEAERAWPLFDSIAVEMQRAELGEEARLARALLHMQEGNHAAARNDVATFRHGMPVAAAAFDAKRYLTEAVLVALEGGTWPPAGVKGLAIARAQGATLWEAFGQLASRLANGSSDPSSGVIEAAETMPVVISALAELILARLPELDQRALADVLSEAQLRPWRWRASTRRWLDTATGEHLRAVAALLERVGEREDVQRLRDASRRLGGRAGVRLGYELARRVAPRVFVEDLGRVAVKVGDRLILGHEMRRKVLALLCLLLSRPDFVSTRDDVLDSLWPDSDPASALNSLNQTVYFLRRVFEPAFADDTSPGYVGQDGETIWLDRQLVDCRSRRCQQLIRGMPDAPSADGSVALATEYRGRFALDFAYEEWSATYREALHASYLRVVEHAVRLDLDNGHFARGTFIAERAAEVDPDAEEIQVALVRLYRHSGAHAAAAEQYTNYARVMNDLGVEPTAFGDL